MSTGNSTRITNPKQLVEEFKKSGEFDRLRRELLTQFRNHDSTIDTFTSRVHDIVQQRLKEDAKLHYLMPEAAHSELMQDMDRFPLVQRTVSDLPALTDPAFFAGIRHSLTRLLSDGPTAIDGGKTPAQRIGEDGDGDVEMDDYSESESESESSDEENESESENENEHDKQEGEYERKEEEKHGEQVDQAECEHKAQPGRDEKQEDVDQDQDQVDSDTVISDDMSQNSRMRRASPPPTELGLEGKTGEADEQEIKAGS